MSTSLRTRGVPMPAFEPSTDFPTLEDEELCHHRPPWRLISVIAAGALVLGAVAGFVAGRTTAPETVPAACEEAIQAADVAFTAAVAQFGTIEAGALTVMEEMTEADSLLQDARLGLAEMQRLRTTFREASAVCTSG